MAELARGLCRPRRGALRQPGGRTPGAGPRHGLGPPDGRVAGLHLVRRSPRDAVITSVGVLANEYWLAPRDRRGDRHRHPAHGCGRRRPFRRLLDVGGRGRGRRLGRHDLALRRVGHLDRARASSAPHPWPRSGSSASALDASRCSLSAASIAIPIVWATEWVGGHAPQWGGRYLLLPTALLVILAAAQVKALWPPPRARGFWGPRRRDERHRGRVAHRAHRAT